MSKHPCDTHEGNVPDFVMNVTGTFRDDAMSMQVTESDVISNTEERKLINSKSELDYFGIPKPSFM